jgi:hypothetical protein
MTYCRETRDKKNAVRERVNIRCTQQYMAFCKCDGGKLWETNRRRYSKGYQEIVEEKTTCCVRRNMPACMYYVVARQR